jgi:tetratricopeptide (TPR) repeat protein
LIGGLLIALLAVGARPTETAAAREQARLCEKLTGEESLAACHHALELGLGVERLGSVRQIVARRLASLGRWEELAEHFRADAALQPLDGEVRLRLGSTLLFALGRPDEAVGELTEAVRLAPDAALARAVLASAQGASGRPKEAAEGFAAALRLDEHLLDHRPAMRAAFEAAQRGEAWP